MGLKGTPEYFKTLPGTELHGKNTKTRHFDLSTYLSVTVHSCCGSCGKTTATNFSQW